MSEKCAYCHEPFKSFLVFKIKKGRPGKYRLDVKQFLGDGGLGIGEVKNLQPYGDFTGFKFCPMCGRKLDQGVDQ